MKNAEVDKTFEERRLALKTRTGRFGYGGIAHVAKEIGVDASYLSRCLYEVGKPGKKNIGDEVSIKLDDKFPGWRNGTLTANSPDNLIYGEFEQAARETVDILKRLSLPRQQEVLRHARLLLLDQQQEDQNSIQRAGL